MAVNIRDDDAFKHVIATYNMLLEQKQYNQQVNFYESKTNRI